MTHCSTPRMYSDSIDFLLLILHSTEIIIFGISYLFWILLIRATLLPRIIPCAAITLAANL